MELQQLARRERDRAAAARMRAIANALEGMTRAEAARLSGMERQALRDAVAATTPRVWPACTIVRGSDRKPRLNEGQFGQLRQLVLDGPGYRD